MKPTVNYDDAMTMLDSGAYELVIYNSCYGGGPHLSEKGKHLFKVLQGDQPNTPNSLQLQLKVVHELGVTVASGSYSQFAFALVRKGLRKYVHLNEYDGLESPAVCVSQMVMEEVEGILEAKGVLTKEEYNAITSADTNLTDIKL